jgi:2-dehydropantoate 2-reductase
VVACTRVKVGVMGAGAIGCYVGGRLATLGHDVRFIGRARAKEELAQTGMTLVEVGGNAPTTTIPAIELSYETDPALLADRDVVLVCVKSAQTREVGKDLAKILPKNVLVVSMQNGVRNADVLREELEGEGRVLGGIVGFNVVMKENGTFRRATTGPLVIEASPDPRVKELADALERGGFEMVVAKDIRGLQWSKLIMNLNNALSALTDAPTPRLVFEKPYSRIVVAVIKEALAVLDAAGVKPKRLGPMPVQIFPFVLGLPTPLLKLVARIQIEIDPDARSSMWEDLHRGRPTEVDWLNGEIVRVAEASKVKAPLNERIVSLIKEAEKAGKGSPKMPPEELWKALTA